MGLVGLGSSPLANYSAGVARVPAHMTKNARGLRREATDAERLLWVRLLPCRPRFARQHVVGSYILDFACRSVQLAVEIDGSQHIDSPTDVARTAFLEGLGWRVIRFWNSDVLSNPDGVAEAVLVEVGTRLGETHPRPLPVSREGSEGGAAHD